MSLLLMLAVIRDKLDHIRRDFLWQGCSEKQQLYLMKWDMVIKHKELGGFGLGCLKSKHWALLAKWFWRFGEEEGLWRRVIVDKYGEDENGWVPSKVPRY